MEEDDDAAASGEAADDELNLKMFGIHQALPVAGEPDWDQGVGSATASWVATHADMQQLHAWPISLCSTAMACTMMPWLTLSAGWAAEEVEDAFEYLRRVQHERAQVPAVVRVELPMSKLEPAAEGQWTSRPSNAARAVPAAGGGATAGAATSASAHRCASSWAAARQKEDDTQPPDWALPTATWLQEFTQQFQALRQQLQQQQEQPGGWDAVWAAVRARRMTCRRPNLLDRAVLTVSQAELAVQSCVATTSCHPQLIIACSQRAPAVVGCRFL